MCLAARERDTSICLPSLKNSASLSAISRLLIHEKALPFRGLKGASVLASHLGHLILSIYKQGRCRRCKNGLHRFIEGLMQPHKLFLKSINT